MSDPLLAQQAIVIAPDPDLFEYLRIVAKYSNRTPEKVVLDVLERWVEEQEQEAEEYRAI